MAKGCCTNADMKVYCCASCRVIDSTQHCIDLNGIPANGFDFVYSDDYTAHATDDPSERGPVPDGPEPVEEQQREANGQNCCDTACTQSLDCGANLFCMMGACY